MIKNLKPLIRGVATYVPGINQIYRGQECGTYSARYCYSVWLRHLVTAKRNGLNPYPKVVAELGPGNSLGIGLAALISGSEKYFGFDVVAYSTNDTNLRIFDELVTLFRNRTPIPGPDEFPVVGPFLEQYDFPVDILDKQRMNHALGKSRVSSIKAAISKVGTEDSIIQYKVPWYGPDVLEKDSVDMIYSQAVLEHVDDLRDTYKSMHTWLTSTGFISHQIDFKCHGTAEDWNGHWKHSDLKWRLIRGRRPFLINREPHSVHISILNEEGFHVVCDIQIKEESGISKDELAPRFRSISNDDLTTRSAFIQARK